VLDELAAVSVCWSSTSHAVSDWGHDFRPDYRRVADSAADAQPDDPVLATTANR
jgi:ATP-dependent DNA helicase RecQ